MKQNLVWKIRQKLLEWCWRNIRYRKFTYQQQLFLVTFEQGIRARKAVDETLGVLLRLNVERAKLLFSGDFEELKAIEDEIGTLGKEWTDDMKMLDAYDGQLWRKVFMYFLNHNDNETTAKVWGAPMDDVIRFRAFSEKIKESTK